MLTKLLEPLTAIGCALGAASLGALDGGLTAGAVIGGAALMARFREKCQAHGLDSAELIGKTRRAAIRDWDRPDQTQEERDAISLASNAMAEHIADCLPSREELAATALKGDGVYPAAAAALVVDRLAERSEDCRAMFAAPADGAPMRVERRFALEIVESALRVAKDDPDYAPLLTLDLVIEIAGGVGRIEAMLLRLVEEYRPAAEKLKVMNSALLALARPIAENIEDPQQALDALDGAINEFLRVREDAARGTNLGELVDRTLRNIAAANERGAFDEGAKVAERAFEDWSEQREIARQGGLRLVETTIEQHRLRFDAPAMAQWIVQRLRLVGDGSVHFSELYAEQVVWYQRGLVGGLLLDLDVSIALARAMVEQAPSEPDRAVGNNNLAIALKIRGERSRGADGIELLDQSEAAFRAALEIHTKAAAPVQWAVIQNNLGNVLQALGERTGKGAMGLSLLAQAVTAYRAALTVRTEEAAPYQWAMTQNNLANALATEGEWRDGAQGFALLAEAVSAYRLALKVRTESEMPTDWAMTQNNLGTTLSAQGQRTDGAERMALLAEAVNTHRAALTVYTEAATPTDWAVTQNNLGAALREQVRQVSDEEDLAILAAAANAYRSALRVFTLEHFAWHHELTATNLAGVEAQMAAYSN